MKKIVVLSLVSLALFSVEANAGPKFDPSSDPSERIAAYQEALFAKLREDSTGRTNVEVSFISPASSAMSSRASRDEISATARYDVSDSIPGSPDVSMTLSLFKNATLDERTGNVFLLPRPRLLKIQQPALASLEHKLTTMSTERGSFPEGDFFWMDARLPQQISYENRGRRTSMFFVAPRPEDPYAVMKPNIDTMLLCLGLDRLQQKSPLVFENVVDIGSGSGFVAKHVAPFSRKVTALDISSDAMGFMRNSLRMTKTLDEEPVSLVHSAASLHQELRQGKYTVIASNPPYVPTLREVREDFIDEETLTLGGATFWKGIGLIVYLLGEPLDAIPDEGQMVLVISSVSLKSLAVQRMLRGLDARGFEAEVLVKYEAGYKHWLFGQKNPSYLETKNEERNEVNFGGELNLFTGITHQNNPRGPQPNDGRLDVSYGQQFYWQHLYVIRIGRRPR